MSIRSDISIKICGMRDPVNITEVGALMPAYMGFIFYPGSPRYVGEDFELPATLSPEIRRVGVFVNESTQVIAEKAARYNLDLVQLHGNESPEQCRSIGEMGWKVIKVFSVDDTTDFSITRAYADAAYFFMFDTRGKYFGGNSKTFNWELLKKYDQQKPFFLSGGLTPENIKEVNALAGMNLHAIDVNSGVELSPGLKDVRLIRQLKERLLQRSN